MNAVLHDKLFRPLTVVPISDSLFNSCVAGQRNTVEFAVERRIPVPAYQETVPDLLTKIETVVVDVVPLSRVEANGVLNRGVMFIVQAGQEELAKQLRWSYLEGQQP